jgi:predicted ester cyclase
MDQTEDGIASVRAWVETVWNQGDLEALERFHPQTFLDNGQETTPRQAAVWHETMRATYPDLRYDLHDILAAGDQVAFRWMATGTHLGTLWGVVPPSGREVRWMGMHLVRVTAGRISEIWALADVTAVARQLDVRLVPPAEGNLA